jgi:hypothetical protein
VSTLTSEHQGPFHRKFTIWQCTFFPDNRRGTGQLHFISKILLALESNGIIGVLSPYVYRYTQEDKRIAFCSSYRT